MKTDFLAESLDPELELRLTAYVLGEASDFEAAQLQELINQRAELSRWVTQLQQVHGALSELALQDSPVAGEQWRLSDERRARLLSVLDQESTEPATKVSLSNDLTQHHRVKGRRKSWLVALTSVASVLLIASFMLMPANKVARQVAYELKGGLPSKYLDTAANEHEVTAPEVAIPSAAEPDRANRQNFRGRYALSLAEGRTEPSMAPTASPVADPSNTPALLFGKEEQLSELSAGRDVAAVDIAPGDSSAGGMIDRNFDFGMGAASYGQGEGASGMGGSLGYFGGQGGYPGGPGGMAAPPGSGVEDRFGVWGGGGSRGGEGSEDLRRGLDRKDVDEWFFQDGTNDGASTDKGKSLIDEGMLFDDEVDTLLPRFQEQIVESKDDFVPRRQERDELVASAERFSTFSLHVSDVSFKLAMEALSQRRWPEADRIRIEEFLNAIDYRDPLPSTGQQVACRIEQAMHPFMLQRNVLRIAIRTSALGRSSQMPLRLTLLLDNSGSMQRADRAQTVRRAFATLASQLTPEDKVTLISFASVPRLLADQVSGNEIGKLIELINSLPSEGGTNLEAALQLATEKALEHHLEGTQSRIVLLTDGAVNLGDADPERLATMVLKMRESLIAFDAAGISADGLNDEVLEALTRQGDGRYYLLGSAEAVEDGFAQQIAGALRPSAKNVKVQVEFNPQRVGRYKLFGFEKHRLKQEDFRNDQVDAAELAATEAGVALYQIEPLADGSGDIGTVAVRFQDLNTGEMVEQRWPIRYEASPLRIEQANSSLRIATAAVMFATFLRGDAPSESDNLLTVASQLLADIPTRDRNQLRVQYLMAMIENARALQGQGYSGR